MLQSERSALPTATKATGCRGHEVHKTHPVPSWHLSTAGPVMFSLSLSPETGRPYPRGGGHTWLFLHWVLEQGCIAACVGWAGSWEGIREGAALRRGVASVCGLGCEGWERLYKPSVVSASGAVCQEGFHCPTVCKWTNKAVGIRQGWRENLWPSPGLLNLPGSSLCPRGSAEPWHFTVLRPFSWYRYHERFKWHCPPPKLL